MGGKCSCYFKENENQTNTLFVKNNFISEKIITENDEDKKGKNKVEKENNEYDGGSSFIDPDRTMKISQSKQELGNDASTSVIDNSNFTKVIEKQSITKQMRISNDDNINILKIQSRYRGYQRRKHFNNILRKELEKNTKMLDSLMRIKLFGEEIKKYEELYPGFSVVNKDKKLDKIFFTDFFIFRDGNMTCYYNGYLDYELKRNGNGILYTSDFNIYNGIWVNNEFTGYGKHIDSEGNLREGMKYFYKREFYKWHIKRRRNKKVIKWDYL